MSLLYIRRRESTVKRICANTIANAPDHFDLQNEHHYRITLAHFLQRFVSCPRAPTVYAKFLQSLVWFKTPVLLTIKITFFLRSRQKTPQSQQPEPPAFRLTFALKKVIDI
jgi:hypothetical protein